MSSPPRILVGIGALGVTNHPQGVVRTLALGSCVAAVVLEPRTRTIGLVHIALPESQIDIPRATRQPAYFADTGITALLEEMERLSGKQDRRRMMVKLAGGAQVADPNNHFNIGKRNALAVKRALWQLGLAALAEDLGGSISRTVTVDAASGRVIVSTPNVPDRCI